MKRLSVLMAMSAGLLLGAGALWAIPPDQGESAPTFDYVLGDCGGNFEICEAGDAVFRWKLFFFKNGDPKRWHQKASVDGMIYECGNVDNFLPYNHLSYSYIYDYVTDEEVVHGLFAMITVPGYGQIFKEAGTIAFDFATGDIILEAGEHEWFYEDFDAVCDYLMNGD